MTSKIKTTKKRRQPKNEEEISETLDKVSVSTWYPISIGLGLNDRNISQSRKVSVSTSMEFLSLDKSQSQCL